MTNLDLENTNNFNINNNTYKIFNSGIHERPYFIKIKNLMNKIKKNNEYDSIKYNQNLFKIYHEEDFNDLSNIDEDLYNYFWEKLSYWDTYFQPLNYIEEIAYKCDLIPFKHQDRGLLALGGCGMDLSPKLDAYQALTHGTIDSNSRLFSEKSYFEYVVGIDLTKEIIRAISNEKR